MQNQFKDIYIKLFDSYSKDWSSEIELNFANLKDSELSINNFSFYTSVSAVFSSKIEGEPIELDSYIKHKRFGGHFLADYTKKIDDLYDAYQFAKTNPLNKKNLFEAHKKITKHILKKDFQGKIRKNMMYVLTNDGRIEYVAADPNNVKSELDSFLLELENIITQHLSFTEIFFYAALIHLIFVKIHPFEDGNGRTARLLEKWFLAEKLGEKSWLIQSEKMYYNKTTQYYANIRKLGLEYDTLDYGNALPFLLMLPESLKM